MHRTKRDMELHDKNKDGFVSFKEFEPPSWASSFQGETFDDSFCLEEGFTSSNPEKIDLGW